MSEETPSPQSSYSTNWVGFRPEIKVLDCTIRDGGLMNDSRFSDDVVRGVLRACAAAGIDYMEIGYKNSKKLFSPDQYGAWRHCDEDDLRRIVEGEDLGGLQLCAMADAEKSDYKTDILPREKSALSMIRIACYIHQIPLALEMARDAQDKGYDTCVNLMAASTVQESELGAGLDLLCQSGARAVYLVDSFGHFYTEEVRYLVKKYLIHARPHGMEVGVHMHNNLQLAFANTVEGIVAGANYVDATMGGLGRGAGNCPLELLLGFLHNPKFKLRPVLECLQTHIDPLRAELGWGFDIPYMITGLYNRHPRSAIKHNASEDRGNHVAFYDKVLEDY
ncbi:MAG: nucleoid-structuring protein H-NS [Verrucomicrobia bacterium]|nr:MAG: nucleoid-structuring protein H-NS [Verrucomicrobiota bacterium]